MKGSSKLSKSRAIALATMTAHTTGALAQVAPPQAEVRLHYYFYQDWQSGPDGNRMEINNPTASVSYPIADTWAAQASFTHDTLSGATTLYHDTLTGASGLGVGDQRWSGNLTIIKNFEDFDLVVGADYSEEQDYESIGSSFQANVPSADRNTTVSFGLSTSTDDISATNNPQIQESRKTLGGLLGITQVINQRSIVQSNLTYSSSDGFLTDQYRLSDNRPSSREQWAWLTRYNLYFPETEGALHIDYRLFADSWNVLSNMFELQWHQEFGEHALIRPLIRYYTQRGAFFYDPLFPPLGKGFYSADGRLASLGSLSGGLRAEYQFSSFSVHLMYELITRRNGLRMGGKGSPDLESFYAQIIGAGITFRW